ncbi:MAG TPA: hypothetical protein PKD54_12955 [Pirellulaceae bacterium]|nr:hypothetical protein [Pirellulaceae bacterium]
MSQTFSIPCPHCQQSQSIAARQAGQQLTCLNCQKHFEAPKLRDLRALSPGAQNLAVTQNSRPNPLKAGAFALGLILLIVGSVSGYFLYRHAAELISPADVDQRATAFGNTFADSSPADVWRFMEMIMNDRELPPFELAEWRTQDELGRFLRNVSFGLFGLSGLGFVVFVGALWTMVNDRKRSATK